MLKNVSFLKLPGPKELLENSQNMSPNAAEDGEAGGSWMCIGVQNYL